MLCVESFRCPRYPERVTRLPLQKDRFGQFFDLTGPVADENPDPNHTTSDLAGYEIESVVRTSAVELDSPGSDPNGDGNWTDYEISGTFEIYGHPIPEPASLIPLAAGGGAILMRRNRGGQYR